ncbi:MAG: citrate lyase acyl carrier protein [Treponema sp.]|nr:citrate lyase acyl carrier protein [Treponema sp.]
MKIVKTAAAGTLESSDVYVEVRPGNAVSVEVESAVAAQFGQAITQTTRHMLDEFGVEGAHVFLKDRGALDCVIRARVETALRRAAREG